MCHICDSKRQYSLGIVVCHIHVYMNEYKLILLILCYFVMVFSKGIEDNKAMK